MRASGVNPALATTKTEQWMHISCNWICLVASRPTAQHYAKRRAHFDPRNWTFFSFRSIRSMENNSQWNSDLRWILIARRKWNLQKCILDFCRLRGGSPHEGNLFHFFFFNFLAFLCSQSQRDKITTENALLFRIDAIFVSFFFLFQIQNFLFCGAKSGFVLKITY